VKTAERDGYSAIQLGFDPTEKKVTKPELGHFKKAGNKVFKKLREIRLDGKNDYQIGQTLTVEQFAVGDEVSVTGTTKGKGFQGVRKRHNFKCLPKSHGASNKVNSPGSIGASSSPSRVYKGTRMGGHMGDVQLTVRGSEIIRLDPQNNLLIVKGAVPGSRGGYVIIKKRK
jgi:large subunit ribosomal protein L3